MAAVHINELLVTKLPVDPLSPSAALERADRKTLRLELLIAVTESLNANTSIERTARL